METQTSATFATSLRDKIEHWSANNKQALSINGLNQTQWAYFFLTQISARPFASSKVHIWLCPSDEAAEALFDFALSAASKIEVVYYPSLDGSPYQSIMASEQDLLSRLATLQRLTSKIETPLLIITSPDALLLRQVELDFFKNNHLVLQVSDIISPEELAQNLVNLGYAPSTTVEEPGTFVRKGEIFDIYPAYHPPVRLHYFDDMIESIYSIDLLTQKTQRSESFENVHIGPSPSILARSPFSHNLRENIPMPQPQFKNRFELRKRMMNQLQDRQLFENAYLFTPYFFQEPKSLYEFLCPHEPLYCFIESRETKQRFLELPEGLREEYSKVNEDISTDSLSGTPESLFQFDSLEKIEKSFHLNIDLLDISSSINNDQISSATLRLTSLSSFLQGKVAPSMNKREYALEGLKHIKDVFSHSGEIHFLYRHESSKSEFNKLLEQTEFPHSLRKRISYLPIPLDKGFYYETEKFLAITEGELFSSKRPKVSHSQKQKVDLFAEQLATLKRGDFVIHQDHGLGEYLGLESFDFGGSTSDYLVINYAGNDKVYVPVYKLNIITKHAEASSQLRPESLRSNKFQTIKSRAKNSAKKLAFDLLKLQAERQSVKAYSFTPPDEYFSEFESAFPFDETPDQLSAIENVLNDMQRDFPMDHLVCGDVGFGKTEVAMRAAFKAVVDHKQVAVLVPTTILAFQHFNSFTERFKNFPIKIEFLSRFKSPKEVTDIKKRVAEGNIDILIGTHKILSDSCRFRDLGLVIVDEEQRFGVGHKEKLKVLKSSVDFLTLTATPIPRTLQLAFLGIRDLSLIQTPPPRRQSIKSYIIKEDDYALQSALRKEISRGGQAFIVHNRVSDMENYVAHIRELVPEAKIVYAHGQMPEKELEKRMKDFYEGKYNILVSTTIIESGIDIPNANTMIIDRADTYGLSQLHQLRGRIGRSDKKAYAYFVVPKLKPLTPEAEKRLQALQLYSEIGAGFHIATSDLEIRGAGDILGADQSGHLEAIGLELYMELLKEAIHEIKGEKRLVKKDVEISTPFPAFIPNHYISDSGLRLKTYKRLSNCESVEHLAQLQDELTDVYGQAPEELRNLFAVLEVRLIVSELAIKSIQVAGTTIILNFEKSLLERDSELRNKVVEVFLSRPKIYQFSPDFKVTFINKDDVSLSRLIDFAKDIAQQILPC